MLKLFVGYVHLLSACLALGTVLITDWRLYRGRHYPFRPGTLSRLLETRRIVLGSLVLLWVTGGLLVWLGYAATPASYFANPKIWAKISVAAFLTANGLLLHLAAFPRLRKGMALMDLARGARYRLAALGAISCVSWLYAAFLGIARGWNFSVKYAFLMEIHGVLLLLAAGTALALFAERSYAPRAAAVPD